MSQRWIRIVVLGLASGCGTPGTPTATAAPASSVGTTPRVQEQGAAAPSASGAIAGVPNADRIQKKKEREPSEPQAAPTVTTVLKGGSWFEDGHAGWVRLVVADGVGSPNSSMWAALEWIEVGRSDTAGDVKLDASVYKRRVIDELADQNQFNAASLFDSSTGQGFAVDTTLLNQCSAVVSRIVPNAVGTYSIAQEPKNKNARQLSGALCGDIVCEAEGSRLRCSLYDPHGRVTFAGPFALCKPSKTSKTVSCAKALPATLKTWQDAKEIKFEGGYWLWLDSDRALVPDGTCNFLWHEKIYQCRYKIGQVEKDQSVHCP